MEDMNSDDSHDRFKTYEEPEADDDEYDSDKEAVRQFIAAFGVVDPDNPQKVKTHKDRLLNAFTTWAKINNIDLNKLSHKNRVNQRKGEIKKLVIDEYDIKEGRYTVAGERSPGFGGIELSDIGEELLDIEIE